MSARSGKGSGVSIAPIPVSEAPDETGEEEEGVVPRKLRDPRAPTKYEVEQHNLTHIPYRNWCPPLCTG